MKGILEGMFKSKAFVTETILLALFFGNQLYFAAETTANDFLIFLIS